jgi:chromosome segregation ATPase
MSDEHADFINGLHVVAYELQRVICELDEMQDRRGIPALDRVSLNPLQWALNKLADDLHDAIAEIRKARLEVVSARRGEEDAREVRDAACQLHLFECRKHSAEVERRLALEKQVAEVTAERDEARQQQQAEQLQWASFYNGLGAELHKVKAERDGLQRQVAELTEKLGELPDEEDEPIPEP